MKKSLLLSMLCVWSTHIISSASLAALDKSSLHSQSSTVLSEAEELASFKKALKDEECCKAYCKKWSPATYPFDVDTLIDPSVKKSWGTLISLALITHRSLALSIAELVQEQRSNKVEVFSLLFSLWYKAITSPEGKDYKVLQRDMMQWFIERPFNIDTVKLSSGTGIKGMTIGQVVDMLVEFEEGFEIANAFQQHRHKQDTLLTTIIKDKDWPGLGKWSKFE